MQASALTVLRAWKVMISGSYQTLLGVAAFHPPNPLLYSYNTMWRVSQDWDRMLGEETGPGLENGASTRRRANFPFGLFQCARGYSGEHQLCGLVLSVKNCGGYYSRGWRSR